MSLQALCVCDVESENVLGELPIPCLFKYTEVLLYYSFVILNFTIQFTSDFKTLEQRRYSLPDYFPGWWKVAWARDYIKATICPHVVSTGK